MIDAVSTPSYARRVAAVTAHALMYHDVAVADAGQSGLAGTGDYELTWAGFVDHLDRFDAAGAGPPTVLDSAGITAADRMHRWVLTFDDGGASAVEIGRELRRRDWRAHFFITTGLIGSPGFVDADGIRELRALGHVLGSHSVSHPSSFASLSEEDTRREWEDSIATLSEVLGEQVRTASVPGGHYRRRVAEAAARAGLEVLFTSEPTRAVRHVGGCLVVGRYAIRRDTTGADAAAAVAGDARAWLRQYVAWNVRKPAKALGGQRYDRLRRRLLSSRSGS